MSEALWWASLELSVAFKFLRITSTARVTIYTTHMTVKAVEWYDAKFLFYLVGPVGIARRIGEFDAAVVDEGRSVQREQSELRQDIGRVAMKTIVFAAGRRHVHTGAHDGHSAEQKHGD